MAKLKYIYYVIALSLSLLCIFSAIPFFRLPTLKKKINILGKEFYVWVVSAPHERERGLQNIVWLPKGRGMLFNFPQQARYCFWNKNTWIKLRLIFMREGRIVQEAFLLPIWNGKMSICPDEPVDAVLELADN